MVWRHGYEALDNIMQSLNKVHTMTCTVCSIFASSSSYVYNLSLHIMFIVSITH